MVVEVLERTLTAKPSPLDFSWGHQGIFFFFETEISWKCCCLRAQWSRETRLGKDKEHESCSKADAMAVVVLGANAEVK